MPRAYASCVARKSRCGNLPNKGAHIRTNPRAAYLCPAPKSDPPSPSIWLARLLWLYRRPADLPLIDLIGGDRGHRGSQAKNNSPSTRRRQF